ncbi:MAG: hypothetical protein VX589_04295 [Myxococcota bacterium]|nr:hypothetical protein [Myxococcota bacterium]
MNLRFASACDKGVTKNCLSVVAHTTVLVDDAHTEEACTLSTSPVAIGGADSLAGETGHLPRRSVSPPSDIASI